jgi:hypothetical protein
MVQRAIEKYKWHVTEDGKAVWAERLKIVFLASILTIVIGVPLLYVASIYGYWAVINMLCVILTLGILSKKSVTYRAGSAFTIMTVNVVSRLRRFWIFLRRLKRFEKEAMQSVTSVTARLRASYLSSTGHDYAGNLVDALCDRSAMIGILLLICSLVFGRARNGLFNLWLAIFILGLIAIRTRRVWGICYIRRMFPFVYNFL